VLTILATVYFGWHYLVDDVAGLGIGAFAVWLAWRATGGVPASAVPPQRVVDDPVQDPLQEPQAAS
jgi:hypothetical protein